MSNMSSSKVVPLREPGYEASRVAGGKKQRTGDYGACDSYGSDGDSASLLGFSTVQAPLKDRKIDHSSSDLQTFINLFKANFGPGFLALPLAVSNAGIIPGAVGLLIIGAIATHCMLQLLDVAGAFYKRKNCTALNYAQVAQVAAEHFTGNKRLGIALGMVVNVFLIVTQFGFCTIYFVFMAQNLSEVFCSAFGVHLERRVWIAMLILPFILASSIRNLANMVPFCMVSNILLVYCIAVIIYAGINSMLTHNEMEKADILRENSTVRLFVHTQVYNTLPLFFASAIFAFESIGMVLPMENRMKRPRHAKAVFSVTLSIVSVMYALFATFGYLVYGTGLKGSITLNLNSDSIGAKIAFLLVKLFFSYIIYVAFMLQFYVPMDFLEPSLYNRVLKVDRLMYRFPRYHWLIKAVIQGAFRVTIILLIAVTALTLPDLQDLITLIGAMASSSLALIFPPLLDIMCFWASRNKRKWFWVFPWPVWLVKDILILLLGVAGMVLGMYTSIRNISHNFLRKTDESCTRL